MEYEIVSVTETSVYESLEQLKKTVNEWIRRGWKPQGGVSVEIRSSPYEGDDVYASQAMVKEE